MLGFSFDGIHCGSFGIIMRSKNRPVLPEPKRVIEEIPARHGVYDFSAANPYGRVMYNQREVSVECRVVCKSVEDLRQTARQIAQWLSCGEARLIFDDEPFVYYLASVANRIDLEQQVGKVGGFTLLFDCRPFAYSTICSGIVPAYGEEISYGDRSQYGGYNIFTATNDGVLPCYDPEVVLFGEVIDEFTFNVQNLGTYVKPKIEIEGIFDNLRIISREMFLQLPAEAYGSLLIDCENRKAILNENNIVNLISGTFLELAPGDNIMRITADDLDCDIRFVFDYRYF